MMPGIIMMTMRKAAFHSPEEEKHRDADIKIRKKSLIYQR